MRYWRAAGKAVRRVARHWRSVAACCGLLVAVGVGCRLWPHPPLRAAFPRSMAVYDDAGHLLRLTLASDGQYRLWTPYKKFSPQLVKATLLHEDQWFWFEPGFNPWGLVRGAWVTYALGHHPQGGSTIAMQLARLLYHLHTRSILGKLWQIAEAVKLELFYSKQQILTAYLNFAPYGSNVVGAGTASLVYFDQSADKLTLPEALTLAVLPQHPSRRLEAIRGRDAMVVAPGLASARNRLYQAWLRQNPDDRRWQALFAMPLALRTPRQLPFLAPHAVDEVIARAQTGGWPVAGRVNLTIDLGLQRLLTQVLKTYVSAQRGVDIHNAAAILVDTRTMGIKALVGSADYFKASIDGQVNGTLAERSPGSTLKPFLYALAFDQGVLTPATVLRDVPSAFGPYTPENFDGRFEGPVTATQALTRSRNVPAVWVDAHVHDPDLYAFLELAGVKDMASRAQYGLALVLGGGNVTMQDLARMYALLPNRGLLRPLRLRADQPQVHGRRLISPAAGFVVQWMLERNPRPGAAFGTRPTGLPVYWKTGTSWAFHDAWTAGGFGPYVLVVWVGNFDSTPNPVFVGIKAAAPLFFRIYDALRANDAHLRALPQGVPKRLKRVQVCMATGLLPSHWCPARTWTWFLPGVSPIRVGHVYRPVVISNATGQPACPPYRPGRTHVKVYQYWPSDLTAVFARAGMPLRKPPRNHRCAHAGQMVGEPPAITSPLRAALYTLQLGQAQANSIGLSASDDAAINTQYWFVNNAYVGHTEPGQTLAWRPAHAGTFMVRVVDDHGQADQRRVQVGVVR